MPKPNTITLAALKHLLPKPMVARLLEECAKTGDDVAGVLADAVDLHFDELAGAVDFSMEPWSPPEPAPQPSSPPEAAQAAVTAAMAVAP